MRYNARDINDTIAEARERAIVADAPRYVWLDADGYRITKAAPRHRNYYRVTAAGWEEWGLRIDRRTLRTETACLCDAAF